MKILRTASLGPNFTGSYKKESVVWSHCAIRLFCGIHRLMVSIYYEAVPQFKINLITEFNERKGYQGIRIIKNLSLKMQEATSKVSRSPRKKNNMSDKSYIPTQWRVQKCQGIGDFFQ